MGVRHEENVRAILDQLIIDKRPGIEALVKWLDEETDYFIAPSSTKFHCACEGGLVEHSLNVANLLFEKNERFGYQYPYDTLAICGLFHDLCKVNYYVLDFEEPSPAQMKYLISLYSGKLPAFPGPIHKEFVSQLIDWKKNSGDESKKPPYTPGAYNVKDQFPIGHGEKSVIMLQRFVPLSDEEAMAIRWHMVAFDAGVHFNYPSGFPFREAVDRSPLVTMLFTADMEASNLLESTR